MPGEGGISIHTARLRIAPMRTRHARALRAIGNDADVARMVFPIAVPWSEDDALSLIQQSAWGGQPGFRLGIFRGDDHLVGTIGLDAQARNFFYFLGRAYWGQGLGTEAVHGFLADAFARFSLSEIWAEVFQDNPASARVLHKLGFTHQGEAMGTSKARLEPAPVWVYRLSRSAFEGTA